MFITFEGVEGCGKSTQAKILAERVRASGEVVILTREPGGSPIGPDLRKVLLGDGRKISPMAELLLYAAERAEHVTSVIRPALGRGETVVCDRYADATRAYQAFGRGIDRAQVEMLHAMATGGLEPDLTLFLRLPVEESLGRARGRGNSSGEGRFEAEDMDFHRRVGAGYEALLAEFPSRIRAIDATGSVGDVAAAIWESYSGFCSHG